MGGVHSPTLDWSSIPTFQIRLCPTPKYRVILTFRGIKDTAQIRRLFRVTELAVFVENAFTITQLIRSIRQIYPKIAKWDAKS